MSPELENRIYKSVLRAVLWGTERDEIFHMLEVNGITGAPAEEMFRRAWSERVAVLRSEGVRQAAKGALLLAGGCVVFCVFWFGFGVITGRIFVLCGLLGVWGFWWFTSGVLDAIWAPTKKGSVTPD